MQTQPTLKKPIKSWSLVLNGKVVYENNSVALCQTYKATHALTKAKLKAVY